jgi:predicted CXXCH cytochrome family protein
MRREKNIASWPAALLALLLLPTCARSQTPPGETFAGSAVCAGCHSAQAEMLAKHEHRALSTQEHGCESCHGPGKAHAESAGKVKLFDFPEGSAAAANPRCFTCHANLDKPWKHAHPPVAKEGCVSCHEGHGSGTAHLLREADVRTLCRQCHFVPMEAEAGVHGRAHAQQSCTECHRAIHGSDLHRFFIK